MLFITVAFSALMPTLWVVYSWAENGGRLLRCHLEEVNVIKLYGDAGIPHGS